MKKILLTIAAIALLAAPASANVLSIWADVDMLNMEVATAAPYAPFNVYVFLEPGADGAFAVEYKLIAPLGHFSTVQLPNPVVSAATIGVWFGAPGISAPFTTCQTELFWVVNLTMMAPDVAAAEYVLALNDNSNFMGVAICPGDRPMVDGSAYNKFGFNMEGTVGTEETSWGAIKSMMD